MLVTDEAEYLVHSVERQHIWLEVIGGDDAGRRVSVPIRDDSYDEGLNETIHKLEEGLIISAVLVSESEESPNWRPRSIEVVEEFSS